MGEGSFEEMAKLVEGAGLRAGMFCSPRAVVCTTMLKSLALSFPTTCHIQESLLDLHTLFE